LCVEWCTKNPGGTVTAFTQHWDSIKGTDEEQVSRCLLQLPNYICLGIPFSQPYIGLSKESRKAANVPRVTRKTRSKGADNAQ